MIADLTRWIFEGYAAPRQSVRRLLDGGYGLDTALLLLVLGYVIGTILELVFIGGNRADDGTRLSVHLVGVFSQLISFFLLSALVFWIGRSAGGTGTLEQVQLAIGWHALVTSVLTPVLLAAVQPVMSTASDPEGANMPEISGGAVLVVMGFGLLMLWLLANYIAEVHNFRSAGRVMAVMMVIPTAAAFMMTLVVGA